MNVRQKLSLAALCMTLPAMASAQAAPAAPAEAAPAAAPAAPAPAPAVEIKPYGMVQLTGYMSMGKFSATDNPSAVADEDRGSMVFSARQSRMGVNVTADGGFTGAKLAAKIETDFFGGYLPAVTQTANDGSAPTAKAPTSNKWDSALLRLRYAFASATWDFKTAGKLQVLAGQTDGLVNPLHPDSANYAATPVFMAAGNLYRRTPQLRAQYDYKVMDKLSLTGQFALLHGTSADSLTAGETIDWGSGNKSAIPDIEFRVAAAAKFTSDISATLGVGYHFNKRVYPNPAGQSDPAYGVDGTTKETNATLLGIDLNADITKYLTLRGEFYSGTGTDDQYAGLGAGVFDSDTSATEYAPTGFRTTGLWAQAQVKLIPEVTILAGFGQASVNADDLLTSAAKSTTALGSTREKNSTIHGGVVANAGKNWRFGLEVARTTSTYWTDFSSGAGVYPAVTPEMSATQVTLGSRFTF